MPSSEIFYMTGDATAPVGEGQKLIVHVCNDIGAWGAGFVLALSKRWKEPEKSYKDWFKSGSDFELGKVQFVQVEESIVVANVIGQTGIRRRKTDPSPVSYSAIESGLIEVADFTKSNLASVHMPRIGCGLAGGDWTKVEEIIDRVLIAQNIHVIVYDPPK
jgi:O-acetyl-ADP-ribose deacetylase (regulator of RNase III)